MSRILRRRYPPSFTGQYSSGRRHDAYSTASPAFDERHRVSESEVDGLTGLVRVDIGEPVKKPGL